MKNFFMLLFCVNILVCGESNISLFRYLKYSRLYSEPISLAAEKYQIPMELIEAVITVESNWDSRAKGANNCNGLMQVRGGSLEPRANVLSGTKILKHYLMKCKNDVAKALTAYNRGYAGMREYYKKYGRPSNYARRILKLFYYFKNLNIK